MNGQPQITLRRGRQLMSLVVLAATLPVLATAAPASGDPVAPGPPFTEFTAMPPGVAVTPDRNTRVYFSGYSAGPAQQTVIQGKAPRARFWSLAVLDQADREISNLSDLDVKVRTDGTYTAVVRLDCTGVENCLSLADGPAPALPGRIYYRVYNPEGDDCGGSGLPSIEYAPAGQTPAADPLPCQTSRLGGDQADVGGDASGQEPDVPPGSTGADPQPRRYDGPAGGQFDSVTPSLPPAVADEVTSARKLADGGSTFDNAYVTATYNLNSGNVVFRAKAPTYRHQWANPLNEAGRSDATEQTRYWSLCSTHLLRTVDCLRDERVKLDANGFFTVIVAPRCPVAGYANCLRAGVTSRAGNAAVGTLFYRNLLAGQDFANEAGPKICPPGRESEFCGDYAVTAKYVPRPTPAPTGPATGGDPTASRPPGIDGKTDDWSSFSTWIGGQSFYHDGEFVYQDYVYDDEGAKGIPTTDEVNGSKQFGALSQPSGTFRYPTTPARYGANAADILQLRFRRESDDLRILVRLNTLLDPDTTAVTLVLASPDAASRRPWPFAAGVSTPGDTALTLWGDDGAVTDQISGLTRPLADFGGATAVSTQDNTIEASIPLAALPRGSHVRVYAASGLWDSAARTYMAVGGGHRSVTQPGGAVPGQPRLWNVAFRPDEVGAFPSHPENWFEDDQALALTSGDITKFSGILDLEKLSDGTNEVPEVPRGRMVEVIDHSSVTVGNGEGIDEAGVAGRGAGQLQSTSYHYLGAYQPYALYVPRSLKVGAPLALVLHGGSANHTSVVNQAGAQRDLAEHSGRILVSPLGRGPAGQFTDPAEVDTLEALDDARRRFDVDPDRIYASGYSMGGYGTYRMVVRHPDLFAAGVIWDGNTGATGQANGYPAEMLENTRDTPLFLIHSAEDELVPYTQVMPVGQRLDALGYEYRFDTQLVGEHVTEAAVDSWQREDAWMSAHVRNNAPRHVTWKHAIGWDTPAVSPKLVTRGAYWITDSEPRVPGSDDASKLTSYATVDATSSALAGSDAGTTAYVDKGTSPDPYVSQGRTPATTNAPSTNELRATLTNVASVTFDLARAGLSAGEPLDLTIQSDGPATLDLSGDVPEGASLINRSADGPAASVTVNAGGAIVDLPGAGSYELSLLPPAAGSG